MFISLESKYYNDSGSQYMLNSAAGVMFPIPIEPPKKIIFQYWILYLEILAINAPNLLMALMKHKLLFEVNLIFSHLFIYKHLQL